MRVTRMLIAVLAAVLTVGWIGSASAQESALGSVTGGNGSNNVVGGRNAGEANVIAYNGSEGVYLHDLVTGLTTRLDDGSPSFTPGPVLAADALTAAFTRRVGDPFQDVGRADVLVRGPDAHQESAFDLNGDGDATDSDPQRPRFEFWAGETCFGIWEPERMGMEFAPQKNAHPAFHVDDVAKRRAELEAKGVEFNGEIFDSGVCHMAFFTDPDGNDLMLHRRYAP